MPTKRRRPGESEESEALLQPSSTKKNTTSSNNTQPTPLTRAAARQTPIYPPPIPSSASPPKPAATPAPVTTPVPLPIIPGQSPSPPKPGILHRTERADRPATIIRPPPVPSASGLARAEQPNHSNHARVRARTMASEAGKENLRLSRIVSPDIAYHVALPHQQARLSTSSLLNNHGYLPTASRMDMASHTSTVTPVLPPKPPTLAAADKPPLSADRNIDKVVLGNLCFKTWYPSYYGKEVLGDTSGNARNGTKDHISDASKAHGKKDREHSPMLERLYVCPSCFKYAKELVAWWGHVRSCELKGHVPGKRVYVHPRGRRKIRVAHDGKGPGPKKRRGDGGVRYTEQVVQDEGEWSVWEVDGEVDGLFCQNLSLFAKLFLDNKSVFFDVTGFNYFLLVYTPPFKPSMGNEATTALVPQVTGFFSKEKMSWDNNNLACILVFPPWQRKGLGALLMGVSYEISRREGILGGPEKPISDLGKKGYRRFWSGEIARWLLGLEVPQIPPPGMELMVDVNDCSNATWITPDDCLGVLRDMGVLEDAGVGPGKPVIIRQESVELEGNQEATKLEESSNETVDEKTKKKKEKTATSQQQQQQQQTVASASLPLSTPMPPPQPPKSPVRMELGKPVPRVRVDKDQIRRYVALHRINLEKTCDSAGFAEVYAMKVEEEITQ